MSQPRSGSGLSRAAHMRVDLGQPSTIRANVTPPLRQPGGILTPSTTINIDTHSSGTAVHQQIRDLEEKNRALQSRVSEYQTRISELEGELEDEKRKSSVMDEMGSSEKKKSLLGRKSKGFAFTVLPYIIASPAALLSVDLPTDFTSQHSCPCPSNTNPKDLEEAERKAIVWEVQQFLPPGVTPSTQIYKDVRFRAHFKV